MTRRASYASVLLSLLLSRHLLSTISLFWVFRTKSLLQQRSERAYNECTAEKLMSHRLWEKRRPRKEIGRRDSFPDMIPSLFCSLLRLVFLFFFVFSDDCFSYTSSQRICNAVSVFRCISYRVWTDSSSVFFLCHHHQKQRSEGESIIKVYH